MRKTKDLNYWIHYSFETEKGLLIRKSVVCDKYTEVMGKIVTESHDFFNNDLVTSHIIPSKLIDRIILYDKNGKEVESIAFN